MKKLFIFMLLAVGAFSGFIYYKTDSVTLRDVREQLTQDGVQETLKKLTSGQLLKETKNIVNDAVEDSLASPNKAPVQIYKWTDAKGVVHYDSKPSKGASTLSIDPNANVLPMAKAPEIGTTEKPPVDEQKQMMENIEKMRAAKEAQMGF